MNDIMYLISYYCKQMDYLGGGSIYSSKYLNEEKKQNSQIVVDFLHLMNSKQYCYDDEDIADFNKRFNDFIRNVGGLKNISNALDYCEGIEALNPELLSLARQYVDRLYRKMEAKKGDEPEEKHHRVR